MAQPDFVPIVPSDRARPLLRLSTPAAWRQERPAELVDLRAADGPGLGATGPDLGFGLKLAQQVARRAVLAEGERLQDAIAGCFACGARRASLFHRAPVSYDMELAFALWGFLPGAPDELVAFRRPIFAGVAHDYARQRALAGSLSPEVLRLSPKEVEAGLEANWRRWLGAPAPAAKQ
jgi:hypothetical protein